MKWTIGMPSYNNLTEVYFTVQSLRLYHSEALKNDYEIIVVDNFGDKNLEEYIRKSGAGVVRYEKYTDITGVSAAKNRIFEIAKGEFVLCIDSHILVLPGSFDIDPPGDDMVQGPLMQAGCVHYWTHWLPVWRANMWGIWAPTVKKEQLPKEPIEIWATGAGFFACRRESWLGFNRHFKSFGGETGYIQEKYRKAGRKVWCYPNMVWQHFFNTQGRKIPYPCSMVDRVRNYLYGFEELGLDIDPIKTHYGQALVDQARKDMICA
jgi:glycosyltransferase involved in cell wall biosynthesis